MPGGVMLQIGIHYVDVLEMLLGPVKRVSGMAAQLVLPGDHPDVASLMLEHDGGAISNLTASYASASEYYMMNVYGKEASAYYDLFNGLRDRGSVRGVAENCAGRRSQFLNSLLALLPIEVGDGHTRPFADVRASAFKADSLSSARQQNAFAL